MKKHYDYKSQSRLQLRQNKLNRLRRKSNAKRKRRNIEKNVKKNFSFKEKKQTWGNNYRQIQKATISALPNFSFLDFPENVLTFIRNIDDAMSKNKYQIIMFDISQIILIDIGSVGVLLSKINELSQLGIRVEGNLPINEQCKSLICESGFLNHMKDLKGQKFKLDQYNSNLMVNRGFDRTSNNTVGNAIRKAVEHLTGVEESFRPVYSIAQEMCANSVEHANKQNQNWLFSVWYKDENNICFTMTDIGSGILGTLKRKFSQKIKEEILLTDDKKILERAFEKKYSSQTKDINRNKGLPKIKFIADENYINRLIVISNNVLLDFSDKTNSKILNKKFKGTFYYWELNKNCIEIWKNRTLI